MSVGIGDVPVQASGLERRLHHTPARGIISELARAVAAGVPTARPGLDRDRPAARSW
jgi:hypothetical protein